MEADASKTPRFFFRRYVEDVGQLRQYMDFGWFGLYRATDYALIEEKLYPQVERLSGAEPGTFLRMLPDPKLREFAEAQKASGFSLMHEVCLVRLWSILENVIDEAALFMLMRMPPQRLPDALKAIKGPIIELLSADEATRCEYLLETLKQETRALLKIGVGRFESVLSAVGCGGAVIESVRRGLLEFSEVRNVIVHRGARADARLVERCPWMNLHVGDPLRIDADRFRCYAASADWYVFDVLERVFRAWGPDVLDTDEGFREMLRKRKDEYEAALGSSSSSGNA